MDHTPVNCGVVFNIGHSVPHSLETLVSYLEEELGREANKVRTWTYLCLLSGLCFAAVVMTMCV